MRAMKETLYACSDVTFVELASLTTAIPCFNYTVRDPEVEIDQTVNVTMTDPKGNTPHTAAEFVKSTSQGLSGGAIAGASLVALAGLSLYRRRKTEKTTQPPMRRRWDEEKAVSETSSQHNAPLEEGCPE
jgi:LPXTG-motif cell wall-anchored protein